MYRCRRFGLKLPIHAAFGEFLGRITLYDVKHRPGTPKHSRWVEIRRLRYSA